MAHSASPTSQPKGEPEAVGKGEDGGAPVVAVHGANGARIVWQIPNGGQAAPWHAAVMFVVWNSDRGVFLPVWQRPRWCSPGGTGWRCRQVLRAEDVQRRNVGAVPSVRCLDILCNQGAQCVEREVVGLGFARRPSVGEGVWPSARGAGMQVCDAPAAQPVQLLGAAAAEDACSRSGTLMSSTIFPQTLHEFAGPADVGLHRRSS